MTFISYAQNYEDVTLWRALSDVTEGFYVDVGAWDPDRDSVTRAFSDRGWRGINVEPVPVLHAALQRRRPRDVNLQALAGEATGTAEFFEIEGTGLSTADPATAAAQIAAGHPVLRQPVTVITLAEICRLHAPGDIHFLKIDCEGGERAALAGADFGHYRPWVVLVEAVDPLTRAPAHASWEPLLLEAGYRFAWFDGLNRFYVAAERHDQLAPRLAMPPNVFDGFVRATRLPPFTPGDPLPATVPVTLTHEQRAALTQRCRDCDDVPKVPDAGQVQTTTEGTQVQIMHNGIKVPADGYCGPWMTRLITQCRGHHEPQEERLFHAVARALPPDATMIELGGNWAYYSAWFLQAAPQRRAVVLEPDPANRAVGEQTLRLNGLQAEFVAGFAGAAPAPPAPFGTERSGWVDLPCFSVPQLVAEHGLGRLDLLHCDVQGAELAVLEGCRPLFLAGQVGFVFVSTHAHPISGDPLTHRRCLDLLRACGAVIEAEHDTYESFSGDGLVVARFGPAPPGWQVVPISLARRSEAEFRDPCFDLAEQRGALGLIDRVVAGTFEALLFRGIDETGLEYFAQTLRRTGDVAGLLREVLHSPEFAANRARFAATYLPPVE